MPGEQEEKNQRIANCRALTFERKPQKMDKMEAIKVISEKDPECLRRLTVDQSNFQFSYCD